MHQCARRLPASKRHAPGIKKPLIPSRDERLIQPPRCHPGSLHLTMQRPQRVRRELCAIPRAPITAAFPAATTADNARRCRFAPQLPGPFRTAACTDLSPCCRLAEQPPGAYSSRSPLLILSLCVCEYSRKCRCCQTACVSQRKMTHCIMPAQPLCILNVCFAESSIICNSLKGAACSCVSILAPSHRPSTDYNTAVDRLFEPNARTAHRLRRNRATESVACGRVCRAPVAARRYSCDFHRQAR